MAQDIGLLLRGLGASFSNQVPQLRQEMAQEREDQMRQMEFERQQKAFGQQERMQNAEMMQARRNAAFQDAEVALKLGAAGNWEQVTALLEDRIAMDQELGGSMSDDFTPQLLNLASRAKMGDSSAMNQFNRALLPVVAEGTARGVIVAPEKQSPLSTVGKIEADYQASRITAEQRDQAIQAASRGGTSVNVNPASPTPPTGYQNIFDESGRLVEQRPIQGSPADTAAATRAEQKQIYGDIVVEDIGRYKNLIVNQGFLTPVTGMSGAVAQAVWGTPAADAKVLEQTIGSNIQFDRLQAMREASPTGGALGSITEQELSDLRATLGSIGRSQSDAQLIYNLDRVDRIYSEIMRKASAYPNNAAVPGATPNAGISQDAQNSDPLGLRRD